MHGKRAVVRMAQAGLLATGVVASALAGAVGPAPAASEAASHREAPIIANDPLADITDVFFMRSYEAGMDQNVVMLMDVVPGGEPSSGPNYFTFGDDVLYRLHVDNDRDGRAEDVVFEFEFKTERLRGTLDQGDLPLAYAALPPITALDGPGSEGFGVRQRYSVTMIKGGRRTPLGSNLIAVPSNVGPRTMPDYAALAAQGIYKLDGGVRVFAGERDDPFYIDLGAVFDTHNLRNPGTDRLSGFNVQTIALEVPARLLTADGKDPGATGSPVLGLYGSTSRRKIAVLRDNGGSDPSGPWVQVQRLANPLVNELIIGTEDKDRWNALDPQQEQRFLDYYRNPRLAVALNRVFGAGVPATPRDDLSGLLLRYGGQQDQGRPSELLRLDVSVAPKPLAAQKRLTVLDGDNAGWPNGRRPGDDVTDVAVRVVGGPNFATASDGVDANDKALPEVFPFLSGPWDGRNRVHKNPS